MFYDGDLQSGITLALRDSKVVACFVKGNDEESALWESDYLKDEQICLALDKRAVTLRINAGSQEAQYLSAYYPIPTVPALIIIRLDTSNGRLLLDLRHGETKDSLKTAILKTLVDTSSYTGPQRTPMDVSAIEFRTSTSSSQLERGNGQRSASVGDSSDTPSTSNVPDISLRPAAPESGSPSINPHDDSSTSQLSFSPSSQPSQTVQNLLADRRRRLEINKKEKDLADKAERKAKTDARHAAMTADPGSAKAKQATYAQQQRKRQYEAKLERDRILKQIEHDKAERREKESQRRALAKAEAEGCDGAGGLIDEQLSREMGRGPKSAGARECAIQIRMFDGSVIRNRFSSDKNLRKDIRRWVDNQRSDGDVPYTFKQILAPLPSRTLSISEEEESLQSLNLAPSATLVMVPVQGYTAAYGESKGIVSRGATAGYNIVSAGAGLVSGALGTFLGFGQATATAEEPTAHEDTSRATLPSDPRAAISGISIRTLRDQREVREDHQLYNGNQLNFEPRRDADDKEE